MASIFAPFLDSVAAQAAGGALPLPRRFVFIVKASGIDTANLVPPALAAERAGAPYPERRDATLARPLQEVGLPEMFAPLEGLRERVTPLLSGHRA